MEWNAVERDTKKDRKGHKNNKKSGHAQLRNISTTWRWIRGACSHGNSRDMTCWWWRLFPHLGGFGGMFDQHSGIRTRNLSIVSPALLSTSCPGPWPDKPLYKPQASFSGILSRKTRLWVWPLYWSPQSRNVATIVFTSSPQHWMNFCGGIPTNNWCVCCSGNVTNVQGPSTLHWMQPLPAYLSSS